MTKTSARESRAFGFGRSFRAVYEFYLILACRAPRARAFALLAFLPAVLAVVFRLGFPGRPMEILAVFSDILVVFYLQFLLIILALFYGTSVCSEEVEGKTLAYLATRPLAKPAIILGKAAAYASLSSAMLLASLAVSFFVMNAGRLPAGEAAMSFLRYAGVLLLGLAAYTAFFVFLGVMLRKAVIIGLAFGFGWESVLQYFPGSTQRFSIAHYLKSLLPFTPEVKGFSLLTFRLEPTSDLMSLVALLLITSVCLALAGLVFSLKEYISEE